MILSNAAIDRRTTVYVLLGLIVVAGLYSYTVLPRESNPEVIIPRILVTIQYTGVTASDMESLITIPVERQLAGLSGVKSIESDSSEGMSFIDIEFEADEDIDTALQRVRDKVDQAQSDLPVDAEEPVIREVNVSEMPIMYLSLTGDVGMAVLTNFAEDLEDSLEAIRGVLDVKVVGGVEREIQIIVDPSRATEYAISMADLIQLAQVENVNIPAGSMEMGTAKFSVRVPGEFRSAAEIENLVVKAGDAGIVYMRDIATIRDGFKDVETISRVNGTPAVTLSISKRAGENVVSTADEIHRVIEEYKNRILPGMNILVTLDDSIEIRDMVAELENNILSGLILVMIIMFLFLGFTNAVLVALAIPLSMLIAFTALFISGTTLNMVVLFSLILALGMLVDNGIVVVENIFRHVQDGMPAVEASKRGAGEVAWPIITSTLTTVAAFAPMFFWPGIFGSFMFYLPQTVTVVLFGSLFVGLIVNPALASLFLHRHARAAVRAQRRKHLVLRAYGSLLRLALRWRMVTVVGAATLLVVIAMIYLSGAEIEFMPSTEPRRAMIDVDCPQGTNLATTDAIVRQVEEIVQPYAHEVEFIISNVGSRGESQFSFGGGGSSHIGRVTLDFPKLADAKVMPSTIVEAVRKELRGIAGAELRVDVDQMGPPTDPPINVEISGDEFEVLAEMAQRVQDEIVNVPNLVDLRDDYEKGNPELRVRVDRQQALLTGLSTQFVGHAVETAIKGRKAGEYREGDDEYDVTVQFPRKFREDLNNLEAMAIVNLQGAPVPFSSVAALEQGTGLGTITRINRKRTVTVMAEVQGRPGAEVLRDVQEKLAGYSLPAGYRLAFTGENEEQQESQTFLMNAFVVAVFLIALIMVSQFNSLLQPLIILSSVVLSLAGVFLGLYIFDMPFDIIMAGIGCISLAGVVVNNAIVLIDFINQLRREGYTADEAVVTAGMTRFRPVMLTAVTTILGLIPMAAGVSFDFRNMEWIIGGESSQWWGPMAIVIIFGLSFATLLTLVVVPILYSLSTTLKGERRVPVALQPAHSPAGEQG
jgi:CzcA family heavy metal efflux pump